MHQSATPASYDLRDSKAQADRSTSDVTPFFGLIGMRVFVRPASAGRKTVNIMTKRKKRYSPEQIVRKVQQADRILAEGGQVASVLQELNVTEATYYRWRNH